MATPAKRRASTVKEHMYLWEGRNKDGKSVRGELRAASEAVVQTTLRRQGVTNTKVKKFASNQAEVFPKGCSIIYSATRDNDEVWRSSLQSFDIVGRGHDNPAVGKLLLDIKSDVETGSSLSQAFKKFPLYFDNLYCNLVNAGEQAGILDTLLDRLATYQEKMLAIKGKIKSALTYPIAIISVAFIITAVIMIFVIPAFKEVFSSFGAALPTPTVVVISISDFFCILLVDYFGGIGGGLYAFFESWKRSEKFNLLWTGFVKSSIFGSIVRKSVIARWVRTLATMFAAGVPFVEAPDSRWRSWK